MAKPASAHPHQDLDFFPEKTLLRIRCNLAFNRSNDTFFQMGNPSLLCLVTEDLISSYAVILVPV